MVPGMKRTLTLGAAWTASAAAAIGLGFLAVSLVDASASPGSQPADLSTGLSSTGAASSSTPATAADVTAADVTAADDAAADDAAGPAATVEQVTAGGTVYAGCDAGLPVLAGAPALGWSVDDSSAPGQVEFRSGSQSIEVRVTCVGGVPQFSVEGPRSDGRGRDGGTSTAPAAPAATTRSAHPTGDDSTGRVGGGHGADDGSDDSGGRGGGGHGSDG
jgi:hypothetical protein